MPLPLQVAVVGAGAFGRNHLRVYRELEASGSSVRLAAVIDADSSAAAAATAQYGIPSYNSIESALADLSLKVDAASICVPTIHHATAARLLLNTGVDVLIEKPFAATTAEAEEITALAAKHNRIVQIGHLERFNPAVTAVRRLINRPMFFEAHRLSIFTPRSLDVDVVLDLMIHDLDIVLSLVQSTIREVRAVGLPVLSRKVDIANVRVEFESGCIANFTASRVSTERVRKLRFFQPHQYLSLDFARQDLLMIDVTAAAGMDPAKLAALAALQESPQAPQHPTPGLSLRKVPVEAGEPLRIELQSFLNAVQHRTPPEVSAQDGTKALSLALEINRLAAEHAKRAGL